MWLRAARFRTPTPRPGLIPFFRAAAPELKELREQNGRLKRLLAEAELEKDALREVAKGKF